MPHHAILWLAHGSSSSAPFELAQLSIETAFEPQDGRKILRYTLQLFAALNSARRLPRTTLHVHRLMFFEISTPEH
jgi:hypothetical protein